MTTGEPATRADAATTVRVSTGRVIFDEIDGEILAIDNHTGAYMSLRDTAATLWGPLVEGVTLVDLSAAISGTWGLEAARATAVTDSFVGRLAELGVLEPIDPAEATVPELGDVGDTAFTEPVVEVYTDLSQLLLFDPIHEVDEAGWPNARS